MDENDWKKKNERRTTHTKTKTTRRGLSLTYPQSVRTQLHQLVLDNHVQVLRGFQRRGRVGPGHARPSRHAPVLEVHGGGGRLELRRQRRVQENRRRQVIEDAGFVSERVRRGCSKRRREAAEEGSGVGGQGFSAVTGGHNINTWHFCSRSVRVKCCHHGEGLT